MALSDKNYYGYTDHDRLAAILRVKNGEHYISVANSLNMPHTTLKLWCNNEQDLLLKIKQRHISGGNSENCSGVKHTAAPRYKVATPVPMMTRSKTPNSKLYIQKLEKQCDVKPLVAKKKQRTSIARKIFGYNRQKCNTRKRRAKTPVRRSKTPKSETPVPLDRPKSAPSPSLSITTRSQVMDHFSRAKSEMQERPKSQILSRVSYLNNEKKSCLHQPVVRSKGPIYRCATPMVQRSVKMGKIGDVTITDSRIPVITLDSDSEDESEYSVSTSASRSVSLRGLSPVTSHSSDWTMSSDSDSDDESLAPKDTVGQGETAWPAQNNVPSPGPSRKQDMQPQQQQQQPRASTSRKASENVARPSTSTSAGYMKADPGTPPPPMMMHHSYMEAAPPLQAQPPPPMQQQARILPKPNPMVQPQMRLRVRPPPPPQPPPEPEIDPEPQQVCLRWNSFHSNMQTMFPSLLNREKFVDVTLACEGRSIKCHKVVLSSCSAYLERLLSENPCKHPIIMMPRDLRFWELRALVDFMYRGEVNVEHEQLPSLLAAAEALQIKGLAGPASSLPDQEEEPEERAPSPRHKRKRTMSPPPHHPAPAVRHHQPPPPPAPAPPVQRMPVSPPRTNSPPLLPNSSAVSITRLSSRAPSNANTVPARAMRSPAHLSDMRPNSPGIEITPLVSFEEIKMEPIDISDSNDESMDPIENQDQDFDMEKDYQAAEETIESGGEEEDDDDDRGESGGGDDITSLPSTSLDNGNLNGNDITDTVDDEQAGSDLAAPGYPENGPDFGLNLEDEQDPPDITEDDFNDDDLPLSSEPGDPPDDPIASQDDVTS